jgi:hypothetical protein
MTERYNEEKTAFETALNRAQDLLEEMGRLRDAEARYANFQILFAAVNGAVVQKDEKSSTQGLQQYYYVTKDKTKVSFVSNLSEYQVNSLYGEYSRYTTKENTGDITSEMYVNLVKGKIDPVLMEEISSVTMPLNRLKAAFSLNVDLRTQKQIVNSVTRRKITQEEVYELRRNDVYKSFLKQESIRRWANEHKYYKEPKQGYQAAITDLRKRRLREYTTPTSLDEYINKIKSRVARHISLSNISLPNTLGNITEYKEEDEEYDEDDEDEDEDYDEVEPPGDDD